MNQCTLNRVACSMFTNVLQQISKVFAGHLIHTEVKLRTEKLFFAKRHLV